MTRLTFGTEVVEWIERYCVLPTGEHIGEPFLLMEWQKEWIRELYRVGADKESLQYRWALLGVPKGNGKSPLAAALGLYHMLEDPGVNDPWVVVAAASDKQADIVFDAAKRMCEMSPYLEERTTRYRWEIQQKGGRGKLERVAASGGKLDGKLVSMLILDELHEWNLENWVVLTGGAMKRRGSQIIQITTAGWDQETICYREYAKGLALSSVANPSYFFKWYSAPDNLAFNDPKAWEAANPSWNELVFPEIMEDLAINIPQSQFERYRLNRWVESEDFWLPYGVWESCKDTIAELVAGHPTWLAWDAATKHDSTAIAAVQNHDGIAVARTWVWERPMRPDGNYDETWTLPIVECEDLIRSLGTEYDVQEVAYDPAWITWSAKDLELEGWPMVEFTQSPSRMCPATAALYTAVVQGTLRHDGDAVLTRHIKSARVRPVRGGGEMIEKIHRGKRIDAAVALAMAVYGAVHAEEPEYEVSVFTA